MKTSSLFLSSILALVAVPAFAQCGGGHSNHGGHSANPNHSEHQNGSAKVKAINTSCPVMGREVKPGRDREVVIRGNYYLVCCDGCGPEMSEHYDKYFDKDGVPLNDPKRKEKVAPQAPATHEGHQH